MEFITANLFMEKSNKPIIETVHGSISLLVIRLFIVLFVIDSAHSLLSLFVFDLPLLNEFHIELTLLMFITHVIKNVFEIYVVISMVLSWAHNTYSITARQIIHKQGVLNIKENVYDIKTVRAITVKQGLFGKILNYGDIAIKTSASGGYQDDIFLTGIPRPHEYKELLKHCIEIS